VAACGGGSASRSSSIVGVDGADGSNGPSAPTSSSISSGRLGLGVFAMRPSGTQIAALRESACVANGLALVRRDAGINGAGGDLVAAIQDKKNTIKLWNWRKEEPALVCTTPEKVSAISASIGGDYLVGGGESGTCYLWETCSGALLRVWKAHYRGVSALRFLEGDSHLVTAGKDAIAHVWDLGDLVDARSTSPRAVFTFSEHSLPITALWAGHLGANCRMLSASEDHSVKAWIVPPRGSKGPALVKNFVLPAALRCVTADKLETMAFAGSEDGKIYEVSLRQGAREDEMLMQVPSATSSRSVVSSKNTASAFRTLEGHQAPVSCLEISTSGALLVSGSLDGTCRLWDTLSGQALKVVRMNEATKPIVSLLCMPMPAEIARGHGANVLKTAATAKTASVPPVRPLLRYQAPPGSEGSGSAVVQFRTSNLRTANVSDAASIKSSDKSQTADLFDGPNASNKPPVVINLSTADDVNLDAAISQETNKKRKVDKSSTDDAQESARWKRVSQQLYTTAVDQFLQEQMRTN